MAPWRSSIGLGVPWHSSVLALGEVRARRVTDLVNRLTEAGGTTARVTSEPGTNTYFVLMRDPEGNEFCVA